MTDRNPIYYADLVKPDDSIENAIRSLTELNTTYVGLANTIKQHAVTIQAELKIGRAHV